MCFVLVGARYSFDNDIDNRTTLKPLMKMQRLKLGNALNGISFEATVSRLMAISFIAIQNGVDYGIIIELPVAIAIAMAM